MTDPAAARMPALVRQAYAAAQRVGFPVARDDPGHGRGSASLPGTGQFLATLAAGCTGGSIAELGTGTGIGSAWMAGAMQTARW
jgi:predicted O-methyltransferase YrrM